MQTRRPRARFLACNDNHLQHIRTLIPLRGEALVAKAKPHNRPATLNPRGSRGDGRSQGPGPQTPPRKTNPKHGHFTGKEAKPILLLEQGFFWARNDFLSGREYFWLQED
ncbi:hypothetical protein NHX12_001814 [Muraenolepis orangiensis]|uniref:Uncharacterized protein n=1 Tax=Muraenolepis orangiensis TaxID=630683 RepID=A0A9Q0IHL3_9TELE|nr:hypothetical protein NHX12_001814 [Muraenolepis orangiensis]